MSDDEADPVLLELLRKHLEGASLTGDDTETGVLESAEYVCDHSIDVFIGMRATKNAAESIYEMMQRRSYSTETWSRHPLHPKAKDAATLRFIFTMDILNFSFWSDQPAEKAFCVEYRGQTWTGYNSLVACLQRALEADIPITDPRVWTQEEALTPAVFRYVFRSASEEAMPLWEERLRCLREAGAVLAERYDGSVETLIQEARGSAGRLVNMLARDFACFRDEVDPSSWEASRRRKKPLRFLKRAQIFVADVWACFHGQAPYGAFEDIDKITMFADYRVPQILNTLGCLQYSPLLNSTIQDHKLIPSGSDWEVQIRGCCIWAVELIRREMVRKHPDAKVNAILIDFFLYDYMKELQAAGSETIPHHRTRSIWY